MKPLATLLLFLCVSSCAVQKLELHGAPAQPFDAVIVPGCPNEPDGALSRCQEGRALWAAILWERGWTHAFITSGAAVHSPYVEADAIAQAMAALGVPADRIYVEPNALHTDENMFFALQMARKGGMRHLAVASSSGHAAWGCEMLIDWGASCSALSMDYGELEKRAARSPGVLEKIRSVRDPSYVELDVRERRLVAAGHRRRPPSFFLYPSLFFARSNGHVWQPELTAPVQLTTWAERLSALSGQSVVNAAR